MKRGIVISFSCSPADKAVADRCRVQFGGPFGPTVSTLTLLILRYGLTQLMRGNITLEKLAAQYGKADLESL